MRNLRRLIIINLLSFLLLYLSSCDRHEDTKVIRLEKKKVLKKETPPSSVNPLRIAIGSMITPLEGFIYYKQLLDYIGEKLGIPVKFIDRKSYAETNALLKSRDIDAAFVCSKPYVNAHDDFGLELLAAPQMYGETSYYSYIIVHKDSPIKNFEELRGKTFAFTDPESNSGKLVPTYILAKINETPDSFFDKYFFTYAHNKSVKAVTLKLCDGAAVDNLVWEYSNKTNPEFTSKTKVIFKSPPYGIPPVVVRPGLEPELKKKLKEIFLNVHKDEKGREILKRMMIDKFITVNDSNYDSIRDMQEWIAKQKRNNK